LVRGIGGALGGALVTPAVAEALGVHKQPSRPLAGTLVDVLRERSLLLMVDNCEHLVDEAARLVETCWTVVSVFGSWRPAGRS
jgi:predicted ATPase